VHPVRVAFRLVAACAALQLGQAATACWLLLRYNGLVDRLGPWSRHEAQLIEAVYVHLAGACILATGLSVLLTGAAMAVPRPTPHTRTVVGWSLALVTVALLIGVVDGPDAALLPDSQYQLDHLQPLLPLWYTVQQGLTVTSVIACAVAAAVRLAHESAGEYYRRNDPTATWRGFTSWLDVHFQD
jgi:hypothetical protein